MNDPYLTYSDYILEKMSKTKVWDLNDIIEFVTADDSELSESPDDEDIDQHDEEKPMAESDQSTYKDETPDAVDDISLSAISAAKKHVYRWRKVDLTQCTRRFIGTFNDVLEKFLSPFDYFSKFFPDTLLESIVHQTNLCSTVCKKVWNL